MNYSRANGGHGRRSCCLTTAPLERPSSATRAAGSTARAFPRRCVSNLPRCRLPLPPVTAPTESAPTTVAADGKSEVGSFDLAALADGRHRFEVAAETGAGIVTDPLLLSAGVVEKDVVAPDLNVSGAPAHDAFVTTPVSFTLRASDATSGMAAAVAAPIAAALLGRLELVPVLAAIAVIVLILHRANIARLRAGTEPKVGSKA